MTTKSFKLAENTSPSASVRSNTCAWLVIYVVLIGIVVGIVLLAILLLAQKFDTEQNTLPDGLATTVAPATATEVIIINATAPPPTATTHPSTTPSNTARVISGGSGLTATFTFIPPTRLPATATPTRTHTPSPTPSQTLTPSITPTVSQTPRITATPTATLPPSTTPTSPYTAIPFPNGRHVEVYFDQNSLYIWNASAASIRIVNLSLQGINADGEPTGKSLSGEVWAQFYAELESGKCVAIEITQAAGWLQPSACRDYNAIITPQRSSQSVFWLDDGQTVAFEALWSGQSVGQCSIQAARCDLYLP